MTAITEMGTAVNCGLSLGYSQNSKEMSKAVVGCVADTASGAVARGVGNVLPGERVAEGIVNYISNNVIKSGENVTNRILGTTNV